MRVERTLALALLCGAAAAGDQTIAVGGVRVRVRDPFPESLHKGFLPLLVDVENPRADACRVEMEMTCGWGAEMSTVSTSIDVPALGSEARELFLPVVRNSPTIPHWRVKCFGETQVINGIGASEPPNVNVRSVLYVAERAPAAGFVEQQAQALSDEARPRHVDLPDSSPHFVIPGSTPSGTPDLAQVVFVPHADLPTRFEAYTSVDAVVIDASSSLPNRSALDAIVTFARLGGTVAFIGNGAHQALEREASLATWLEPRFVVTDDGVVRRSLCAQGQWIVSERTLDTAEVQRELNAAIEARDGWSPSHAGSRGGDLGLAMRGLELPYRALTLILVLFAIVVGPINFWLVKRAKKPALILVSVPVIAAAFSLAIFAFGALAQGLDVRASHSSFALLDQRLHRSSTGAHLLLFAGLSAGDGWRFGPGAACLGVAPSEDRSSGRDARLVFGEGTLYTGGYLPVRTPIEQAFVVDRAARERVEVVREGSEVAATNGLGTSIDDLVVHAQDGTLWRASQPIEAGARAVLEPLEAESLDESIGVACERVFAVAARDSVRSLPRGAYVASIASSPFVDAGGIAFDEVEHAHWLVGILDDDETPR